MSVILDALKKLDREKSLRRSGTANIAVEILRPDPPHPGKRVQMPLVIVALTTVVTAALTYAVVEFGFVSKSSPPAPMNPPASSQQVAPAPLNSGVLLKSLPPAAVNPPASSQQLVPAPVNSDVLSKPSPSAPVNAPAPTQGVAPALVSLEPVRDARDEINRVPLKIEDPAEGKDPATSQGEKETVKSVISEKGKVVPGSTEPSAEPTPVRPATTPPLLRLSAIVWHEKPSKRIAMINGILTNEGSFIEGVKVEEIQANRVRLSHNGRVFEISLR